MGGGIWVAVRGQGKLRHQLRRGQEHLPQFPIAWNSLRAFQKALVPQALISPGADKLRAANTIEALSGIKPKHFRSALLLSFQLASELITTNCPGRTIARCPVGFSCLGFLLRKHCMKQANASKIGAHNAEFQHRENGLYDVWEFALNLARHFDDVPAKLQSAVDDAKRDGVANVVFHHGT